MGKNLIRIGICALLCLFFVECASRTDMAQVKNEMMLVRLRLDALKSENEKIMELLHDLNKSLVDLQEVSHRTKADLISEMASLRDQTQYLQSLLDDTGDRMSKLLHTVEDKASRIPEPESSEETLNQSADSSRVITEVDLNPKELYDAAYLDLSRSNYDLALRGFLEYLRVFPAGEYADNAQYWIGEIYYARGDFERAFDELEKIITNYGQGDKVAAALLKMGYCQINLDDKEGARQYLDAVIQRFPNSAEADLARSRLEEL